jgi:hypothetical protein
MRPSPHASTRQPDPENTEAPAIWPGPLLVCCVVANQTAMTSLAVGLPVLTAPCRVACPHQRLNPGQAAR